MPDNTSLYYQEIRLEIVAYRDLSPSLLERRVQILAGLREYFSCPYIPKPYKGSSILVRVVSSKR